MPYIRTLIVLLVFLLVFVVGGILLQIFLSKRQGKWPGLILPIISFLGSLLVILNYAAFSAVITTGPMSEDGVLIQEAQTVVQNIAIGDVVSIVLTFLLSNIPTAILLAIYFACRESIKRNKELERMNIQDLE